MRVARTALANLVLMALLTGVLYPLAMTVLSQLLAPELANGSLVFREGMAIGSALIGQEFTEPKYFWGRLSATSPSPYQAQASSGSNLGPLSAGLREAAKRRLDALRASDPGVVRAVPVDLLTASGSGLDPHISPAAAYYQIPRVAKARGLPTEKVQALVASHTEGPTLGFLGEGRVNVLLLNLALEEMK